MPAFVRPHRSRMVTVVGEVDVWNPADDAKPGAGATALKT
jgi:hypothetical protein